MTDDRRSGIALIAGSLGGILTMAIHPTAGGPLTPAQFELLAIHSEVAHSLAIVSFVVMFLGACGLTRRLSAPDRLAFSGLVSYGFAAVSILIAAAVSGWIEPSIMRLMIRDVPTTVTQWHIVIAAIFQINQVFARIYTVAASFSIALWSFSGLRNGGLGRGAGLYGSISAPLLIAAIGSGWLKLDVHGMAVVVFVHAIWFVMVGSWMQAGEGEANRGTGGRERA